MTGRVGTLARVEADRREAAGEPLVRYHVRHDPGWSYLCPVHTCQEWYTAFKTETGCRNAWLAHASATHPHLSPTWPDTSSIVLPAKRAHTRATAAEPGGTEAADG